MIARMAIACLWLLLGAGALFWLQHHRVDYALLTGPVEVTVAPGQPGQTRLFTARFDGADTAPVIEWEGIGTVERRESGGLWLVATVTFNAESAAAALPIWESATGRRYSPSHRVTGAPGLVSASPLRPGREDVRLAVFELPDRSEANGRLLISPSEAPMMDHVLRMDMPLRQLGRPVIRLGAR